MSAHAVMPGCAGFVARFRAIVADARMGFADQDVVRVKYTAAKLECEQAIRDARQQLRDLEAIKAHSCEFGENDYCATCGADGRA